MKTCTKCGIEKEESEYRKNSRNRSSGLLSECRICSNLRNRVYSRARRKRIRELDVEQHALRLAKNRTLTRIGEVLKSENLRAFLSKYKRSAFLRGMEFAMTKFPPKPIVCPVLGVVIDYDAVKTMSSPSLDRINNDVGYTDGNVRVVSYRANLLKGDTTAEEMLLLYADVLRLSVWTTGVDPIE